jgi:hypothetical protein
MRAQSASEFSGLQQNSYAMEQEISGGVSGKIFQGTGNFLVQIGNSNFDLVSFRIWGRHGLTRERVLLKPAACWMSAALML